ncbi:MAG: ester cyclase [Actinobacteria bacterium]|nr:ester cyclase [Actinomycetota bacterium]
MTRSPLRNLPEQLLALLDAYHRHDPQALAALYSPACRITLPGMEIRGRSGAEAMWTAWFRAFPDVASDVLRVLSEPGLIALEWRERGTHLGRLRMPSIDLPSSGRRLCWQGVSIYALAEDGISSHTYHFDRLELWLQVSTLPGLPASVATFSRLWREARRSRTAAPHHRRSAQHPLARTP